MLIKEFRVTLPVAVPEYQIGQLYSVAKASAENTQGEEGIEILKNEPYEDETGKGQYTEKIYHLGNKVPGFIRAILPASALQLEEKAWNAYPYCKTVLTNPFMGKDFHIIIESRHFPDKGDQDNVHSLPEDKLKLREVVFIDIGKEKIDKKEYKQEEDPEFFVSQKTGRGHLTEGWKDTTNPIMTCYKLVEINFKWWGLQTKVERSIMKSEHDLFLKFHQQAFCWIDEWYGMTLADIRALEDKTAKDLDAVLKKGDAADKSKEPTKAEAEEAGKGKEKEGDEESHE